VKEVFFGVPTPLNTLKRREKRHFRGIAGKRKNPADFFGPTRAGEVESAQWSGVGRKIQRRELFRGNERKS